MIKIRDNGTARFARDGFRFIVKSDDVLVYERDNGTEYSLNFRQQDNRKAYDAKRYQVSKQRTVIDALQTVMNA